MLVGATMLTSCAAARCACTRPLLRIATIAVVSVEVVRGAGELGGSTALMLLAHLAATQPHMRALPARALKVRLTLSSPVMPIMPV